MINKITIYKGERSLFTNKLYNVSEKKPKTFEFSPNLNVITGRNGSGKSVLLKLLKYKTGNLNHDEISPSMIHPLSISKGFGTDEYYSIDDKINEKLSGTLNFGYPKVNIDWDGEIVNYIVPSFFSSNNLWTNFDKITPKYYDDLYDGLEIILKKINNLSAGEDLINTIVRLKNLPKDYHKPLTDNEVNDVWVKASNVFQQWVDNVKINKGNTKPTILIDELDKHLDLDNQMYYFEFMRELSKEWQIILVSHSYFAFKLKNVNYINLNPKYYNKIKKL
jgi:ABC-type molybdenum transport system ATPase subunit/photorepair protein PhrA